jgi:alcohol dehydrogenase
VPEGCPATEILMLADILPTSYEVGVLNGQVRPGDTVAVVGAGPIGLSAMIGSSLYTAGAGLPAR